MSHVGVPASVDGQTAIVPLVNPVVPPAADLLGGATAIPGWGSVLPCLVKKALELLPESWSLEPVEDNWASNKFPLLGGVLYLTCSDFGCSVPGEDASIHGLLEDDYEGK